MLDGACRVDRLIDAAIKNDMPAIAMTDHGVMYGAIDFYKTATKQGIKPIVGCEVYITTGSRFEKKESRGTARTHHLVLLATDVRGYHNLIKLVSAAHLEGFYYKPRIDHELLAEYHEGLIALSSCLKGEVSSHLVGDDIEGAVRIAGEYSDIMGPNNFYLEMQDHGIAEQRKVNRHMPDVAKRTGLPLIATNDVHYLKQEHAAAHEVLLCMQTQTVMSDPDRMRYSTDQFYLKSREEMEKLFREVPEALDNTLEIADRCDVSFEFGKLHFPTFEVPDGYEQSDYLTKLSHDSIRELYGIEDPSNPQTDAEREVMDRFQQELDVIEETGFVNYFLVVWDFIHFARERNIPVGPGRGSGGGSLIAYALGITAIDPLRYDLIFERFLNPKRVSPPDFDIDFCQSRRGEVIEYVKDRYGRENVAQIITFGSLGAKSVIRDVGRVLEIPFAKCDQLSKMVPDDPKMTLERALEMNPEFKKNHAQDDDCRRILEHAFVLEGLYRNPGTHAAGVVIGEKPLAELVPLARDKDDQPITQYTMKPLGDLGLLKMDFLGLKTLTVIDEAVHLIETHRGETVNIEHLPFDDQPTYDLLNRGDTVGVFQLESGGMRDLIRRIGIDKIEDLIAMIALYRPGPMNMLPQYVDCKSGKIETKYDHPKLEPVLKETYGVMVYQEQVQKAANVLAGYDLGKADLLRRAMGKKDEAEMAKQRDGFVAGCAEHSNIDSRKAGQIFDTIARFAGYGFNKAHSTGYAIISYQTAYLKANYPAEFMSALLSCEIGNADKIPVFVNEVREMDLEVLPPDVNSGAARFRPENGGVRFGLAGIKNVGTGAAEAIVREREANGPFGSLVDFCSRIDGQEANKKVIESLVRAGAFDSLGGHRARLFNGADFAMARAMNTLRDRQAGQTNLFDMLGDGEQNASEEELPDCPEWHESELLAGERELLGVYMSGHPLTQYASLLERYQLSTIKGLAQLEHRSLTRLGGIVVSLNKRVTRSKETMAVFQLENLEGRVEVVVFPQTFQQYASHLAPDAAVLVCGEVSNEEEEPRLLAQEIYPLADASKQFAQLLRVHLPTTHMDDGRVERLRDIMRLHPGSTPVVICLLFPSGEKVFVDTDNSFRVLADEYLVHEVEQSFGEQSVYIQVDPTPCRNPRPDRRNGRGRL